MHSQLRHATGNESDLPNGLQVGEYIIEGKIGEGGFGAVYRASHPMIGKLAAVKVLSRKYSGDPEIVSRFAAEARAVNQIRHRNIIDIFAFGALDDGRSYYVMELLDGQPLDKILDATGGIPLGDALPILRDIARALDAAHAKGIAHRDLKPENIFIQRDSDGAAHAKLLDFGIAKLLGEQSSLHKTRTGSPLGTPYYMSPEQCRGQSIDHRTDIYSFGCVAYQLLTGSLPFDGDNHLTIMMKQTTEEPVPASERAAENPVLTPLPSAIDEAIAWCMRKDPAERPGNLLLAVRALEEAAGIELPLDTRTPTPNRLTPLPRRPSTPAFGTTALAQTMAATGEQDVPAPAKKSRAPLWIGLVLLLGAAGAAAFVVTREEKRSAPAVTQPDVEAAETSAPAVEGTTPESAPPPAPPEEPAAIESQHATTAKSKPRPSTRTTTKPTTKPAEPAKPEAPKSDPYARH